MQLIEIATAAVVTFSVAGISYATLNPRQYERDARKVAEEATCRTVDGAIVAYLAAEDRAPSSTADLTGYVKGDISAYRIVKGVAAGPGC